MSCVQQKQPNQTEQQELRPLSGNKALVSKQLQRAFRRVAWASLEAHPFNFICVCVTPRMQVWGCMVGSGWDQPVSKNKPLYACVGVKQGLISFSAGLAQGQHKAALRHNCHEHCESHSHPVCCGLRTGTKTRCVYCSNTNNHTFN